MQELLEALRQDSALRSMGKAFQIGGARALIYGLGGAQKHAAFAAAYLQAPRTTVIIVHDAASEDAWDEDLRFLLPKVEILHLPEIDRTEVHAEAQSMERRAKRLDILGKMMRQEACIILARAQVAAEKGLSRAAMLRLGFTVHTGEKVGHEACLHNLVQLGYTAEAEVERRGQFSTHGGMIDVFPVNAENPCRLEFFDEEIDSLRAYDIQTRRSRETLQELQILPVAEMPEDSEGDTFLSFVGTQTTTIFDEPMRIREQIIALGKENPEQKKFLVTWERLLSATKQGATMFFALLLQRIHSAEPEITISVNVQAVASFRRQMDFLKAEVQRWLQAKETVFIFLGSIEKARSLRELFAKARIPSQVLEKGVAVRPQMVNVTVGALRNGFELPQAKLVVVTERDIFGHQKRRLDFTPTVGEKIAHFGEIHVGDYVVHATHGVGKYLGVKTLEVGGVHKDYLAIQYAGADKLFVPTDQVQSLEKYIGPEGETPRLHHMGGSDWIRAKAKARAAVEDIADELMTLYAKRKAAQGFAFSADTPWQKEFEDAFPYEETPDQLTAIAEIKKDMESPRPMERLLCGDVGFGKTEVAMRAAYKAVLDHKQVAVLVPTTVLAQQHFQTFSARFQEFGVNVDVICRFRTAKEQALTLKRTEAGKVDILIGTHAILNAEKVRFADLGLLIVDEEQRFGVKQKERLKAMATGMDILTLSATPIPRTLHMSLTGVRDMSLIETAPAERFPVQTYVLEENTSTIENAIRRELKRGGQVYFVYNHIESIDRMRERLMTLVPQARIQTAHGQMPEELLERVMVDFYEGHYDVLLATSIIENGLDVANANTVIVYDADHFGLSQLYQMRGRVGRAHQMAFAYFIYRKNKTLSETAEKRLQAMRDFAQLGVGYKIALRDLEIRGAGSLLGAAQHGHMASVGYETYARLLQEALQRRRGEQMEEQKPEPVIDIGAEAYLEASYMPEAMHKMEFYRRLAAVHSEEELQELTAELVDRFGEPTAAVAQLLLVTRLRVLAREVDVRSVVSKEGYVEFHFWEKPSFAPENLLRVLETFGNKARMLPPPINALRIKRSAAHGRDVLHLIIHALQILAGKPLEAETPDEKQRTNVKTPRSNLHTSQHSLQAAQI